MRLGNKVEGKGVVDDFLLRHPKYETSDIGQRLGGTDPRVIESRDRLIASLREIGMRDVGCAGLLSTAPACRLRFDCW